MSSHLQWELIKKSSSFLVRDKKTGVTFSKVHKNSICESGNHP